MKNLERKVSDLEKQLEERDSEIKNMVESMRALEISKSNLATNTNKCLNEMREFIVQYQNYVKQNQTNF